ncbi:hypothetical protein HY414_01835 [Candidatus Kaiserbacteria bacterium]|nr:hypothetical protein [Candidatus Kaiserbacteria bacterium]
MANLLSPQAERKAQGFYRSRFVFTGALVAIVCGIIGFLALLPVYMMVRDGEAKGDQLASQTLPQNSDREDIARARIILKGIQPYATSTRSVLTTLEEIFVSRPSGMTISSISLKRGQEGQIVLAGASPSRESINTYRETLAKNPRFTSVTVPIGVLAGTGGSPFTLTLKGSF